MTLKDDLINDVRTLLSDTNIVISDNRLSFLADDFIDEVCIFCRRDVKDFPQRLEKVTAKIIYYYLIGENSQVSDTSAKISSISEDGRSVNYSLDKIVIDEKNQLYATNLLKEFKKWYRVEAD